MILTLMGASETLRAAEIEKLLMPGPVSAAHSEIEGQCSSCHDRANRARQTSLCLDCHKETAADVRSKQGFHGRMPGAQSGECQACHTEHRGREADIVRLDVTRFDHALTDLPLSGAHSALSCQSCHESGRAFRDAPHNCVACHRSDDAHGGSLGTECATCHETSSWNRTSFDHDKTRFPLRERHQEVPCGACHFGERYQKTPLQCSACHAPDDIHRGSRGTKCADCHTTGGWETAKFDHARETGFALVGRHARVGCADCHRSGTLSDPLPTNCAGCHRSDDRHTGRFGTDCGDCHANDSWRLPAFDHLKQSKFALEGAHASVDCHACHTGVLEQQKLATDCGSCHRTDDTHGGALGTDCAQCHGTHAWKTDVAFDHDLTAFPLVGLHVIVTCGQCHDTKRYRDADAACHSCHAKDDVHTGSMGTECADCHSPNGWKLWQFDHTARTRFALTGAHERLQCANCHAQPAARVRLATDCASCHLSDDVHSGQFGRQCQRCHSTVSFRGARPN